MRLDDNFGRQDSFDEFKAPRRQGSDTVPLLIVLMIVIGAVTFLKAVHQPANLQAETPVQAGTLLP